MLAMYMLGFFSSMILSVHSTLTTSYDGRACPGSQTFTCQGTGMFVDWTVTTSGMMGIFSLGPTPVTSVTSVENGITVTASFNSQSTNSFNSTLTTEVNNGSVVSCSAISGEVGSVTVEVADPPSQPRNITSVSQQNSPNSVDVTIGWDPPADTGGVDIDSYSVTISPPAQLSATVVTSTTVTVSADYNVDYTVSIVVTNCAGNSTTGQYSFRIGGCPVPTAPVSGSLGSITSRVVGSTVSFQCDPGFMPTGPVVATCIDTLMWSPAIECSPSTTGPPVTTAPQVSCGEPGSPSSGSVNVSGQSSPYSLGSVVTYHCDDGLFPAGVMNSTCADNGEWRPNPASITCRDTPINCTLPGEPANGAIVDYGAFNETVVEGTMLTYQCDCGLSLTGPSTITCTNAGQWSSDPVELTCTVSTEAPSALPSTGVAVAVSVVVTFIIAVLVGFLAGLLVMYMITHNKTKCYPPEDGSTQERQANVQPTPAGPVYEEVSPAPREDIELKSNEAYGPVRQ